MGMFTEDSLSSVQYNNYGTLLVDGSNTYNTVNTTHRCLPLFEESQEDQEGIPAERLSKHSHGWHREL